MSRDRGASDRPSGRAGTGRAGTGHAGTGRAGTEMEQRLSQGLARLANRAVTSPDALERILQAGSDAGTSRGRGDARHAGNGRRRETRLVAPVMAVAAAVLVVMAIAVPKLNQHPNRRQVRTASPPGSAARVGAPDGAPRAAWLSAGTLHMQVEGGSPVALGPGSTPQWSADGKWLAYLASPAGASGSEAIRVVRSDGTDNHQVLSAPGLAAFMWSPTQDVLAAVPLTPSGKSTGLVVLAADGTARYVVSPATPLDSIMWSASGLSLAYTNPQGVFTVPESGGSPSQVPYSPPAGSVVILAGWWPGDRGLLLWPDTPGSVEANGLALTAVPLAGGPDQVLGTTLVFLRWLAWSPDGTQLALVSGAGPSPTAGKSIRLCRAPAATQTSSAWSCHSVPQPAGTVSLDPAWSPDSSQLAFVRATAAPASGPYAGSYRSRTLYVASSDGANAHPLAVSAPPGAPVSAVSRGVVLPAWSASGAQIGYSTGSDVVLVPARGGRAQIVASALSGSSIGSSIGTDYYGKSPWQGGATWSTGPAGA